MNKIYKYLRHIFIKRKEFQRNIYIYKIVCACVYRCTCVCRCWWIFVFLCGGQNSPWSILSQVLSSFWVSTTDLNLSKYMRDGQLPFPQHQDYCKQALLCKALKIFFCLYLFKIAITMCCVMISSRYIKCLRAIREGKEALGKFSYSLYI